MTKLFTPITYKNMTIKNRIVMSPMCMYSCEDEDGKLTPFHLTHYISRAVGQIGLIMLEASAVEPAGRITAKDLGIWDDAHVSGLRELVHELHRYGSKAGIQLAHAGRKAEDEEISYAPSPLRFNERYQEPSELDRQGINRIIKAFGEAARRAKEAEFDMVEIHAAHGYLINEFLSPIANQRTDEYGGSKENRFRFLQEVVEAVSKEFTGPIFVRISTDEYHQEGNTLEDFLYYATQLKELGIDLIDCSSGGVVPAKINTYPGYQIKRCETIKHTVGIPTGAVGLITTGIQAEEILQNNRADLIFIGRSLLNNPYWAKEAADELNYELEAPKQYARGWK
ncbi:NADPH dehydrogenase NamA [Ornithinibacillus massiliensis]|uniref:NADPH dehydrogenase NamA n=1 Tax=Ornithinibacillus massiliensis TaxID=1944633 RepID=A0ABS5MC46_9BACI|nr:NADPH dehydrogenase NamA [Ornithinibacillus massiliensis]MBS3679648.1 NADPH dehydrogenase NamA [Ornithinibacillus massiliensis]